MATSCDLATGVCEATAPRRPKVLVIDDEPRVIDAIKRRLAAYAVDVLEGYHGLHGIWRGVTERPDVVITDIKMPHARGEEVIECLRRNPSTSAAPIFVLTGAAEAGLERRLRERGVVEYFAKPADLDELIGALSKYITLCGR